MNLRDIWKARSVIKRELPPTPLMHSAELSTFAGVPVYLKLEQLQPSGSFKLRGATHMISSLTNAQKEKGVVTFSTGNHGFAVARSAAAQSIRAVICVAETVTRAKIEALEQSGAELRIEGKSQDEAGKISAELVQTEGLTLIPPFDHPSIIAGQGTMGLELLEELPDISAVIAGLSGGGLLSGLGLAMKETDPAIEVHGATISRGAAMQESLRAGHPVEVEETPTLADSLLGGIGLDNQYTMKMIERYTDIRCAVSEEAIARAMAFLYKKHRLIVEGGAAVGVSALLEQIIKPDGPTVVIITGNSIDPAIHYETVTPYL